jgi:hypothetical protein
MGRNGWSALAPALTLLVVTDMAAAQSAQSDEAVSACLCLDQLLSSLDGDVLAQLRAYGDKREAFEALDKQLQTQRLRVNVKIRADTDAFKQLRDRRDAAADELAGPVSSRFADLVNRYNEAVAQFNNHCAGKSFDPDAKARVSQNLVCPKP